MAHLKLQASEGIVVQAAASIYSAYITANRVSEGQEAEWMKRSIREAIKIAVTTDQAIISDEEIHSLDSEGSSRVLGG